MDAALRIAAARLQSGKPIWDPDEEKYMLDRVTAGLSPELSRKAYVLWKDLNRMSRGRQYRFFVEHDKSLVLNHEPDIVPELGDGPVRARRTLRARFLRSWAAKRRPARPLPPLSTT